MAGFAPRTTVLALGAGALGGPDALRLLLETAGRSPLHDILTCVLAMAALTAHVLGTTLLVRFVRKARAGGGAPATDLFARVTATVSVGAALLVTACLLAGSGGLGALRLAFGFAAKNPIVAVTVLTIGAGTAAGLGLGGFFPYTMPPLRFGRRAGAAAGASPAGDRATSQTLSLVGALLVAACLALVVPLFAPGAIDARWSFLAAVPVAVAAVLLARSPRGARDASGAPAADTRRSVKLTRGNAAFVAVDVASHVVIPCTMPLVHCGRRAGTTAGGASPAGDRAASQTLSLVGALLVAACLALVVPLFAPGAIDARWILLAGVPVAVAAALLAPSSRGARNAAAPDTRRSGKLTRETAFLAVAAFAVASLLVIPFA
ncbi:uncharacterized protein LOC120702930 [Panicum virgatum]|uniref:Uncharacterized protein n=1 Tax=Panicum virgatum TaxID=38727 RepID=A0A8T0TQK9_PANVG|nr:uncharacterized protein LOC120702930 [Panicum virgatum]KAG2610169.1 hypothetical protein PVAP13_4KG174800 [Panicum virgatum]